MKTVLSPSPRGRRGSHKLSHPSNLQALSQFLQSRGSLVPDVGPPIRKPAPYSSSFSQQRDNLPAKLTPGHTATHRKPKYTQVEADKHRNTHILPTIIYLHIS